MSEQESYTEEQGHQRFAKSANNRVWQLLEKPDRTADEDEEMVLCANASLYHWMAVGTAVNAQRGEWLLAHVYAVLEEKTMAMRHASRCMQLTEAHQDEMKDFDLAYAHEALARAYALQGDKVKARQQFEMAVEACEAIADSEDKDIFMGDFKSGKWYGIA